MARRRWGAYLFGTRGAGWRAILVVRLVNEGSAAVRFVRRVGSSDCGLAVIRHDTQDRLQVIGRVGAELKSNADMPGRRGDDQHLEVAVSDDEVPQPAAVDVAAPGGEGEQGGVDQQLLVQVAVAAGRVLQIRPRSHLYLLTVSGSDIANAGRYREDIIMQIGHRLPSSGLLGQWCWAAAIAWLSHRAEHDNRHAAATTERNAASPVTVCHPSQRHQSASSAPYGRPTPDGARWPVEWRRCSPRGPNRPPRRHARVRPGSATRMR